MKTYGELFDEIDRDDAAFEAFKRGWNAASSMQYVTDPTTYSQAQEAQVWAFYTGQLAPQELR